MFTDSDSFLLELATELASLRGAIHDLSDVLGASPWVPRTKARAVWMVDQLHAKVRDKVSQGLSEFADDGRMCHELRKIQVALQRISNAV